MSTLDPARIREVLDGLAPEQRRMSQWEQNFLDSVTEQYDSRGSLSEKQMEILERLWVRYT